MHFHGPPYYPVPSERPRRGSGYGPLTTAEVGALLIRARELSLRFPVGTECVCTVRGGAVTTRIAGQFEPVGTIRVVVKVAGLAEPVDAREVWVGGRRATDDDPLPRVDTNGGGNGSEVG